MAGGIVLLAASPSVTTLYVSPTGNDANACTQAAPCLSFNRAYEAASAGDTVLVASGVYSMQTITWDASKASASSNVVFQPASSASVYLSGSIEVLSSHVTFENMTLGDPNASGNAGSNPATWTNKNDVEAYSYVPTGNEPANKATANNVGFINFQNINARNFEISGAHDVDVFGGSYGPSSACGSGQPSLTQYGGGNNALRTELTLQSGNGNGIDPYNITIDGVTVHNIMSYDLTNCHTEGVAIFSGSNVAIKNSKFYGNDVYDILAQANSGSGSLGQITLENNWFAASTNSAGTGSGSWGVELDSIASNVTIANNSFNYPLLFQDPSGSLSNVSIVGNILPGPVSYSTSGDTVGSMCGKSGVTAQYNITAPASGQSCTTSTNTNVSSVSSLYTNPANDATMNYALKTGSQAISFVPTSASPVTNDIDYHCRPAPGQTNIDAGASELNATGSCGNPITTTGTPPTVSVSSPTAGATVSGTTTVTATASATSPATVNDVQFEADGSPITGCDPTSPTSGSTYSCSWDTTGVSNGSHTLTAIATDTSGNTTTSSPVTVTVNNSSGGGIPGDINGDGTVNIVDLSLLLSHYGTNYPPAEFDHAATVDIEDLSILLGNYGK